jgi:integrase
MTRLTTARLAKLNCPPGKDRVYVPDAGSAGLFVAVTAAGGRTFILYRRVRGRPVRVRLGAWPHELGLDAARKMALQQNAAIGRGEDPRAPKRDARNEPTFGEVFALHLERVKARNRTWKETQRQFDAYLSHWKNKRLSDITRGDVERLHARLGTECGRYQANRVLSTIGCVYSKTAYVSGYRGENPARGVERYREVSRERFLRADELPKFFKALDQEPEWARDFFTLLVLTGVRRENLLAATWDQFDLARKFWTIPRTKTGDPLTVPLVPSAVEILGRRRLANAKEFIFPGKGRTGHVVDPMSVWRRIVARAELTGLRIHDLRRTLGSWQAAAGVPLHTIGKSLGHRNLATTQIYSRLDLDPVRQAVETATSAMLAAGRAKKNTWSA